MKVNELIDILQSFMDSHDARNADIVCETGNNLFAIGEVRLEVSVAPGGNAGNTVEDVKVIIK